MKDDKSCDRGSKSIFDLAKQIVELREELSHYNIGTEPLITLLESVAEHGLKLARREAAGFGHDIGMDFTEVDKERWKNIAGIKPNKPSYYIDLYGVEMSNEAIDQFVQSFKEELKYRPRVSRDAWPKILRDKLDQLGSDFSLGEWRADDKTNTTKDEQASEMLTEGEK